MIKNLNLYILALLISTSALFIAFYLQIEMHLTPCKLCIWQRWPHLINIIFALILLTSLKPPQLILLAALANAMASTTIAIYHFGLEKEYWHGFFSCTGIKNLENISTSELLKVINETPISNCEISTWGLLGLSLASWNVLISISLAIIWLSKTWQTFSNHITNRESASED